MCECIFSIEIKLDKDVTLKECIREGKRISRQLNMSIYFVFQKITLIISPDSSIEETSDKLVDTINKNYGYLQLTYNETLNLKRDT